MSSAHHRARSILADVGVHIKSHPIGVQMWIKKTAKTVEMLQETGRNVVAQNM